MLIDWASFTPIGALCGGILIGLAAALFVLFNGRIAGISGIVGGLLEPKRGDVAWRVSFLAGLLLAPAVYSVFALLPEIRMLVVYDLVFFAISHMVFEYVISD
jgi:uncharacterized membrane protein YedE/YeeE